MVASVSENHPRSNPVVTDRTESFLGRHKVKILIGASIIGAIACTTLAALCWPVAFGCVGAWAVAHISGSLATLGLVAKIVIVVSGGTLALGIGTAAVCHKSKERTSGISLPSSECKPLPEIPTKSEFTLLDYALAKHLDEVELKKCEKCNYFGLLQPPEESYAFGNLAELPPKEWWKVPPSWDRVKELRGKLGKSEYGPKDAAFLDGCNDIELMKAMSLTTSLKLLISSHTDGVFGSMSWGNMRQVMLDAMGKGVMAHPDEWDKTMKECAEPHLSLADRLKRASLKTAAAVSSIVSSGTRFVKEHSWLVGGVILSAGIGVARQYLNQELPSAH